MSTSRRSVLIGAAALAAARPSLAQPRYPTRPIEMIVAFPAGGGTDIGARSVARFMERHLAESARIGVINRHGAGGEVGWTSLATSRNDGYTIGFINAPAIVSMTIEKQTRFNIDSFDPIGNLVYDPNVLIVHKDSDFNNLADMIAYARANPGALTIGTTGAPGNSEHLALLQVQIKTSVTFNHAPFSGTAPLKTAILGRHVPVGAMSISETLQDAREGKVKILGIMADERHRWAPNVATFREQNIDVIAGSWRAIVAPRGVAEPILAQLREALRKAVADPEYIASSEQALVPLAYLDGPALGASLRRMHAELTEVWQRTPWR